MHHATEAERAVAAIEPMLLERASAPFSAPGWRFEIKHDGYRLIAAVADGAAYLKTRRGANATAWFPEIAAGIIETPGGPHVLDGEVVVLNAFGRADFERLQARARLRGWRAGADDVHFMAFDLLVRDGKDLRDKPLKARKAALQRLLSTPPANILFVDDIDDRVWLFERTSNRT